MDPNYKKIIEAFSQLNKGENLENKNGLQPYEIAVAQYFKTHKSWINRSSQFKLIQFHPSYTYEDFVRGIVADSKGNSIDYKNVNKILGEFADKALTNYLGATQPKPNNNSFKGKLKGLLESIRETIDQGDDFSISAKSKAQIIAVLEDGLIYNFPARDEIKYKLLYSDIEKVYEARHQINKPTDLDAIESKIGLSMKGKFPYYYMILQKLIEAKGEIPDKEIKENEELKNYILIIDEINRANLSAVLGELIYALEYRGEEVESIYEVDGKKELILPPNLYIIGTMNTADRSVGHIDYAIRRRFAFMDVLPKDLSDDESIVFATKLYKATEAIFDQYLTSEFKKKDIQLGHSYFIDKSEEGGSMAIRLQYEIQPILLEYINDGILREEARNDIDKLIEYVE